MIRHALLNLMHHSGGFAPFRLVNRNRVLILTYHRFSAEPSEMRVSARAFAEQVAYLKAHYNVVSLARIADDLRSGRSLPPKTAALTIDDGYLDAYEIALPILREHKVPATIFVVTGFLDGKIWLWTDKLKLVMLETSAGSTEVEVGGRLLKLSLNGRQSRLEAADRANNLVKRLPDAEKEAAIKRIAASLGVEVPPLPAEGFRALSWPQLREMEAAGVTAGSHTVSHPILTRVPPDQLRNELGQSKLYLEDILGHEVPLFCYPNGDLNESVQREVQRAGYRCAVTTAPGLNSEGANLLALRRVNGEPDLAHFAQNVSGFEELKSRMRSRLPGLNTSALN